MASESENSESDCSDLENVDLELNGEEDFLAQDDEDIEPIATEEESQLYRETLAAEEEEEEMLKETLRRTRRSIVVCHCLSDPIGSFNTIDMLEFICAVFLLRL